MANIRNPAGKGKVTRILGIRCTSEFKKAVQMAAIDRGQKIEDMLVEIVSRALKLAAPKSEAA